MNRSIQARAELDRHLSDLEIDLQALGGMVEENLVAAMDALERRDLDKSLRVVKNDELVNEKRYAIEEKCIDLIATQQPMAGDLRIILTCLHVTVELERMGDYAEGIGRISLMMGDAPPISPLGILHTIAEKARGMLVRSLKALVDRDVDEARRICNDDDEIDSMYEQVYRGVIGLMIQDPSSVQRATYLLWVAHDLERLADRATNVAERVVFLVTGELTELNVSKY